MSNTSVFTNEEKERIRKFITPDLRPSYILFKNKNDNPDEYTSEDIQSCVKIKSSSHMTKYLQQFRDSFTKNKE